MTLEIPRGRRRGRFLFDWNAAHCVSAAALALDARTGQVGTLTNGGTAGAATSIDENGVVFTPGYQTPRFGYVGSQFGLFLEGARTCDLTKDRDLTNAAWTATNCTTARTVTGADGGANLATKLTATAGNATVIRAAALVHGSQARTVSPRIQRVTGTGNVQLTLDNGATWTTVAITTAWTSVSVTQTLANSQFGIRLVTNGDAINVDFAENEAGAFASTAIATDAAAVTRSADALAFPYNVAPIAASYYSKTVETAASANCVSERVWHIGDGTTRLSLFRTSTGLSSNFGNGSAVQTATLAVSWNAGDTLETLVTITAAGVVTISASVNGAAAVTGAGTAGQSMPTAWGAATLYLNSDATPANQGFALYQSVRAAGGVQTLAYLQAAP